jgi:hypothetical protein
MVRIIGAELRHNKENEPFVALILQGDLVLVQSAETQKWYATAKKTSITSTFSKEEAEALIGRDLPGKIIKMPCDPYEFSIEETGEIITLSHRWEFQPDDAPVPLRAVMGGMAA